MPDALLEISHLFLERGERLLLDEFALSLRQGEVVHLVGENGAGKTSLLRAIAGLLSPVTASFTWLGQSIESAEVFSDDVLFLGHKSGIRGDLSPIENLRWYSSLQPQQVKELGDDALSSALKSLGLSGYEDELCSHLSAGQKKRVGLARLALSKSPLWLLDEPFTAIDKDGVKMLCDWIDAYATQGGTVVYTSHQTVKFSRHQPRVIALEKSLRWVE